MMPSFKSGNIVYSMFAVYIKSVVEKITCLPECDLFSLAECFTIFATLQLLKTHPFLV